MCNLNKILTLFLDCLSRVYIYIAIWIVGVVGVFVYIYMEIGAEVRVYYRLFLKAPY